jgi:hypothetical protein
MPSNDPESTARFSPYWSRPSFVRCEVLLTFFERFANRFLPPPLPLLPPPNLLLLLLPLLLPLLPPPLPAPVMRLRIEPLLSRPPPDVGTIAHASSSIDSSFMRVWYWTC